MTSKDKGAGMPQDKAIAEALDREGKIYRKSGEFRAALAEVATPVETVLANGRKETKNTAHPGDYIVTGAGGERYVVKPDVFAARYEPKTGHPGVYLARGHVKAIPNPFNRQLHIVAPWGEIQHGAADCLVVDIYDPATSKRDGKPYLINRAEFDATYRIVDPASSSSPSKAPWYRR
ncbi:MAG: PGDYG domain-containing protein [Rhodomicrobium sp.]